VETEEIAARKDEFEKAGYQAIREGKVAALLLAGGMGTRLGLDKPKGELNVGESRTLYLFECLIHNLQDVTSVAGKSIPLYIMTSEKNNDETIRFFREHDFFGYPQEDVAFFVQEMAAAVDYDGKLLLEEPGRLATSPNGNGGWFSSLVKAGLLEDIHKRGVEWINIFAVDNVLQRICDPAFVGATILSGKVSGSKVVRKVDAYEKMGVLCLEDGRPSVVEYYEMSKEMAETTDEQGNLVYAFGVILNYIFRVDKLEEIVERHLPVHVVEKKIPYMTGDGEYVKPQEPNGYKFETLVVDMIRMMDDNLPYEVVREKEFAPIKNLHGVDSLDSARELLKKNGVQL
jgi:UDP-N-acetylglucosamine/UDP-N-acetylgalactosamine diphosphorylase